MPLISRIASPPIHSVREFRRAAGLRYNEGRRLVATDDRLGGVYLWGYAAEMLLKAAYFRLAGWHPSQPISKANLDGAKHHAVTVLGIAWSSNLHDVTKWAELLIEGRKFLGTPYRPAFAIRLKSRASCVYRNWREYLRYFPNRPYRGEVLEVGDSVDWLLREYRQL